MDNNEPNEGEYKIFKNLGGPIMKANNSKVYHILPHFAPFFPILPHITPFSDSLDSMHACARVKDRQGTKIPGISKSEAPWN